MGILKDLLLGGNDKKETRKEKQERVDIRDFGEYKSVYDNDGHWKEDLRWNPESDRWDKLDLNGNVTGHVERNVLGNMVHTDYRENVTRVDKREDYKTVGHYDSKGNKLGYTTKDNHNQLTKHSYVEEERNFLGRKKENSKERTPGFFESMMSITEEYNQKMEEIRKKYEESDYDENEDNDTFDIESDDYYDDDDPYEDEYDADDEYDEDY